jgi:prepilin-type N-terminal cleavage/methylation domain-containing protein
VSNVPSERGFSLIETLVALVLIAIALLLGMGFLLQQPRVVKRIDAERAAMRAMEATMESIRAGTVPLASEQLEGFFTAPGEVGPPDLKVQVTVTPTLPAGLYEIRLRASYSVLGSHLAKQIDSLVWQPN